MYRVGHFRENIRHGIADFLDQHFLKKTDLRRVLWPKCQVKKVSYIDPLVMRFSPKSEIFIGNFHQNFSFLVKPCFLFLQYRTSVLKKTQIFGPLFWALFLLCCRWFFIFRRNDFWKKETLPKGHFKVIFDHFCPSAPMSFLFRVCYGQPPLPSPS